MWVRGKEGQTSASGCVVTQAPSTSLFFSSIVFSLCCCVFDACVWVHACPSMHEEAREQRPGVGCLSAVSFGGCTHTVRLVGQVSHP